MSAYSVTGTGPGSALASMPLKVVKDVLSNVVSDENRQIFDVQNGKVIFQQQLFTNNLQINTVVFNNDAIIDSKFSQEITRDFVAGVCLYDNTDEMILPDSIKIVSGTIEIDLTSFVPLTGAWHLVFIS